MNKGMERYGVYRQGYTKAKARILKEQSVCGICGLPVDKKLKFPHPYSPTVDHIIPLDKGGHPSDIANLQLAHFICNRMKSNKITSVNIKADESDIGNRVLPQIIDWINYKS